MFQEERKELKQHTIWLQLDAISDVGHLAYVPSLNKNNVN